MSAAEWAASASMALDPLMIPAASLARPTTMFATPAMITVRRVALCSLRLFIGGTSCPSARCQTAAGHLYRALKGSTQPFQQVVAWPQAAAAGQLAQAGKIQLDGDESVLAAFAAVRVEFDAEASTS